MDFSLRKFNIRRDVFILTYIVFLINFILNGYEFGATVETVRMTAIPLLFMAILQPRRKNRTIQVQGVLLIITAFLALFFSEVMNISGSRIWNLTFCMIFFVVLSNTFIEPQAFEMILLFYINFAFVLALLVVVGYFVGFGIDNIGRASINYGAFFKDQNYLSAYFMPAFALKMYDALLNYKARILSLIYPITFLLALLLMGSRGSFLTAIGIFVLIFSKMMFSGKLTLRKLMIFILTIGALVGVFIVLYKSSLFQRMTGFSSYGDNIRLRLWSAGLNGFRNNYILGSGVGSASQYSWSLVGNAVHNSFVELISDQGLVGVALISWVFSRVFTCYSKEKLLVICFFLGLFIPLVFLTGYSNMTFWMPMFFLQDYINYSEDKYYMESIELEN